jgi:exodeoxyribonuclease VII small subunit
MSQKLASLSELVAWFESDEFSIELAIEKYKEAEVLAKEIEKELSEFKHNITVLKKDFGRSE